MRQNATTQNPENLREQKGREVCTVIIVQGSAYKDNKKIADGFFLTLYR